MAFGKDQWHPPWVCIFTRLKNAAQKRGTRWTPALLDQFLKDPKAFAPGTKMEFQGLLNPEDRRALVEYLRTSR